MNKVWLCITDKGITYFPISFKLKEVNQILNNLGCKNYECHYADNETILPIISYYLEDCYGLEYMGVDYE